MHRVLAQHEPRRDLAIREPLRNEANDFDLARSEEFLPLSSPPGRWLRSEAMKYFASPRRLGHCADVVQTC